jgi:stage IV sporulation protein FB
MKIRISPAALLLFFTLWRESPVGFAATLTAMLFHEAGHLLAASALGLPLKTLAFDLFGAKIEPALPLSSYRTEILLAAAGPVFSLLLALLCRPVGSTFAKTLAFTSQSFLLFNCLPIAGFDGGRILEATLSFLGGPHVAAKVLPVLTYLCLLLLFSLSACMLLRFGEQLSLAVLSASLFAKLLLTEEKRVLP